MKLALAAAVLAVLYLCSKPWLSAGADEEKMCFSLVEEGRMETVESDIKTIKGMLDNNKHGYCGCSHYLVSGVHGVKDNQITASSSWPDGNWEPYIGRLYDLGKRPSKGGDCWVAKTNNNQQYIQVHLKRTSKITGVVTQGRPSLGQWLTSYKLLYSNDGSSWKSVQNELGKDQVFEGNHDRETPVTNHLHWPVIASYVRLQTLNWHGHISMRFDVLGCPLKTN